MNNSPPPVGPLNDLKLSDSPAIQRQLTDKELKKISKKIDAQIKKDRHAMEEAASEPRVLILGTSDSGKSTLLKQLRILHGGGFSLEEIHSFKLQMYQNILATCATIVKYCNELDLWPAPEEKQKYQPLLVYDAKASSISVPIQKLIANLWKQVYVKSAYDTKQFPIQDTASYFLSRIESLCDPTYTVKNENILHIRTATKKIHETVFVIEQQKFHFFDVNGQRHERKYWVPYFDNVHTILFVISIASYDQTTEESPPINRMQDAMALFSEICNNKLLAKVRKILFLNKYDLFKKKIKINLVRKYIPEAPNVTTAKELLEFFTQSFKTSSGNPNLTVHTTCCTDSNTMQVIVAEVVKDLLRRVLEGAGLAK
ncbi:guanine nucleotide-binding protein subunit alpha [Kappamyces sp. JEL0829]|nr:guanine nucleotide-binding protein subunit alpha [Kappamyces sp. JEL0829]